MIEILEASNIANDARGWYVLTDTAALYIGGPDDTGNFEKIMEGVSNRQITFDEDGHYGISLTYNTPGVDIMVDDGTDKILLSYGPEETVGHTKYMFSVVAEAGETIKFSRPPADVVVHHLIPS